MLTAATHTRDHLFQGIYYVHFCVPNEQVPGDMDSYLASDVCCRMLTYADMQHAHHRYLASNAAQMQGGGNVYFFIYCTYTSH